MAANSGGPVGPGVAGVEVGVVDLHLLRPHVGSAEDVAEGAAARHPRDRGGRRVLRDGGSASASRWWRRGAGSRSSAAPPARGPRSSWSRASCEGYIEICSPWSDPARAPRRGPSALQDQVGHHVGPGPAGETDGLRPGGRPRDGRRCGSGVGRLSARSAGSAYADDLGPSPVVRRTSLPPAARSPGGCLMAGLSDRYHCGTVRIRRRPIRGSPVADQLIIRGAREHNLKDVSLDLPRDALIVFTGLSGSGKSSLAFDTIFAEGQRRYVESLSAYARQFLGQMDKPDVDFIEGLSPGGLHRPEVHLEEPALHRRHDHRGLRLPPPALRPRRPAALPDLRRADRAADPAADRRPGPRARGGHAASRCWRR